jgi:UDP-glucose 4-epimerase
MSNKQQKLQKESKAKNVLVIGGAGYIGSHCVRLLIESGYRPIVLDNLVYGHRASIPEGATFYEGDLGDCELVYRILKDEEIEIVMHFAAYAFVGESVKDPLKYYENNVAKTILLLKTMIRAEVRKFVFSSTCATFGIPDQLPIREDFQQLPINPYGQTKLDIENVLRSLTKANQMGAAVFRYFNAAGASTNYDIGEDHTPETHLIPLAIDAALGKRGALEVFGDDYETPDGTCLRDYIHVDDLSRAHITVFDKMDSESTFQHFNLGTGKPTSVKEIITAVESVTGLKVPHIFGNRRLGDPPALYADSSKAMEQLGWNPIHRDAKSIIESAWVWHKTHPQGYTTS